MFPAAGWPPPNLMPISGLHMPPLGNVGGGGAAAALVGVGAVIGS